MASLKMAILNTAAFKKFCAVFSLLAFAALSIGVSALAEESAANEPEAAEHVLVAVAPTETNSTLADLIKSYKADPNDATWSAVFNAFKAEVEAGHLNKAQLANSPDVHASSPLSDLHARCIETAQARIWSFPEITQSHAVIVEWHESKSEPVAHVKGKSKKASHKAKAKIVVTNHIQSVTLPETAFVKDARVMELVVKDKAQAKTGRYLILAGADRTSQLIFVASYRWSGSDWTQDAQPLSQIPALILHNLHGVATFSGSDLILNLAPKAIAESPAGQTTNDLTSKLESANYKLALHFFEDKYCLEGKPGDDTPMATIIQFVSAIQQGHMELAKSWLADPTLVSIPRYIGLSNKTQVPSYRLIGMASTSSGNHRYRLVTFEKNDLIFEVGKVKQQWAIKSIFVAPANPMLQKIAKSLPAIDSATNQATAPAAESMRFNADNAQIADKQGNHDKQLNAEKGSEEAKPADDMTK